MGRIGIQEGFDLNARKKGGDMKRVVIFDKDQYDDMCYLIHDALECAGHCPGSFYTNEVINKLERVQEMLKEEKKNE